MFIGLTCLNLGKINLIICEIAIATTRLTLWGLAHSLLFLGLTYNNLGDIKKSLHYCQRVISFSSENNFTQIRAKAISCFAALHRETDFKRALFHHEEAIEILKKLGAKCDLADAYYQLGLTYKASLSYAKSHQSFSEAIKLFNNIKAPKQVERVRESMI